MWAAKNQSFLCHAQEEENSAREAEKAEALPTMGSIQKQGESDKKDVSEMELEEFLNSLSKFLLT